MVKFLGDNPATTDMRDKNFLITQEGGKDYIGSWAILLDNLKTDLLNPMLSSLKTELLLPMLKAQIGKIVINVDDSKRDVEIWNDGVFDYLLCNGGGINADVNPELHAIYGGVRPNFQNATIRHMPEGGSRALGSYQADALQNLTGSAFKGTGNSIMIDGNLVGLANSGTGVFKTEKNGKMGIGQSKWTADMSWGKFDFDASRVARTADETRMQNVAVQFYVIVNFCESFKEAMGIE